jgi:molecular chaperone DnaK
MAETLLSSTEKMIEENKDKASDEEITNIEAAIKALREDLENENNTLESLRTAIQSLTEASQPLATKIYEDTTKEADQQAGEDGEVVDGEVVEDE